jgi:hypothetical protein
MQTTKSPAKHVSGMWKKLRDPTTATEANERQGLLKEFAMSRMNLDIVEKVKYLIWNREFDPYTVYLHQRMKTDLTGDDWLALHVVRRRFVDDQDIIEHLLIIIDVLKDRYAKLTRKLRDIQEKKYR